MRTKPYMTLQQLLTEGVEHLKRCEVPDYEWDAALLLFHVLKTDRGRFFLIRDDKAEDEVISEYKELISKRGKRIPLQHLVGMTEFMGLDFIVNEHVLSPRQDTECLVEEVLKQSKDKVVMDMCTGSGCIAISIAKLGDAKKVTAVDISKDALQVARENAKKHDTAIELIESNLFENCNGTFDIIVSNPPYIATDVIETLMPEVREHEPRIALDGTEDGLFFYKEIIRKAGKYLKDGGSVFFEIGYDQKEEVQKLFAENGFSDIECKKDLAGHDRVVSAVFRKEKSHV